MKCKCGSNEFLEFYDGATIEVTYQDDGGREEELQEVGNRTLTTCLNCGQEVDFSRTETIIECTCGRIPCTCG